MAIAIAGHSGSYRRRRHGTNGYRGSRQATYGCIGRTSCTSRSRSRLRGCCAAGGLRKNLADQARHQDNSEQLLHMSSIQVVVEPNLNTSLPKIECVDSREGTVTHVLIVYMIAS
ncbi:hypothetical protein [Dyella sedimenti]|uniref:hypothetical protein n=1 Tax=Dyella sedimenti TaxID=2919947 RepID=UPI001FA9BEF1|nr:hypothetical protein [Dyella sedimenti]